MYTEKQLNQLVKRLNKVCKHLDEIYDLNNGGCCYAAWVIAKELKKHEIPYQLMVFETEPFISINESHCHYALVVNGKIINGSEFIHKRRYYRQTFTNISPNKLLTLYRTLEWNDYYNKKYNSYVKTMLITYCNEVL